MPNIDETAKAWQLELARRVGLAVHDLRKRQGWTALELAQRTKEIGYPISRVAISKIESNTRSGKVDLAELLTLAAALNVSPVALVYPGPYQNEVQILPGRHAAEFNAAQWFSGLEWDTRLVSVPGDSNPGKGWDAGMEMLYSWRELMELEDMRGATLIVDDHDRKRALLYDKQIAVLRKRLGIVDDDA
ncbi:hypothetical protein A5768_14105 [Mycolicibacterium fortuitum]|uniref:helix-turn-helix domain-containing protein n=1 Tax=Mycolicibacterium TaxID=1866885 RepID=UPI0007EB73C8|nr:helix-turn-helix transcriptional regulator [Mycolicibacterium fortuitum]OBG10442.1 hypothetical protein A5768_14105 [Mycolicibacterium fortuitum]UBV23629.1 helix-turn-helix transcriptional regulator [Mycolicibacterium fortuitum]